MRFLSFLLVSCVVAASIVDCAGPSLQVYGQQIEIPFTQPIQTGSKLKQLSPAVDQLRDIQTLPAIQGEMPLGLSSQSSTEAELTLPSVMESKSGLTLSDIQAGETTEPIRLRPITLNPSVKTAPAENLQDVVNYVYKPVVQTFPLLSHQRVIRVQRYEQPIFKTQKYHVPVYQRILTQPIVNKRHLRQPIVEKKEIVQPLIVPSLRIQPVYRRFLQTTQQTLPEKRQVIEETLPTIYRQHSKLQRPLPLETTEMPYAPTAEPSPMEMPESAEQEPMMEQMMEPTAPLRSAFRASRSARLAGARRN